MAHMSVRLCCLYHVSYKSLLIQVVEYLQKRTNAWVKETDGFVQG